MSCDFFAVKWRFLLQFAKSEILNWLKEFVLERPIEWCAIDFLEVCKTGLSIFGKIEKPSPYQNLLYNLKKNCNLELSFSQKMRFLPFRILSVSKCTGWCSFYGWARICPPFAAPTPTFWGKIKLLVCS